MYNLEEILQGSTCTICWLLGSMGNELKHILHLDLDDKISVLYNDGISMIIRHNNQTFALDTQSAHAIKVSM